MSRRNVDEKGWQRVGPPPLSRRAKPFKQRLGPRERTVTPWIPICLVGAVLVGGSVLLARAPTVERLLGGKATAVFDRCIESISQAAAGSDRIASSKLVCEALRDECIRRPKGKRCEDAAQRFGAQ